MPRTCLREFKNEEQNKNKTKQARKEKALFKRKRTSS